MERVVLQVWCWKKGGQQHPESPRQARLARTRCAPRGSRERSSLVITKGAERLSNDSASVLEGPGFVHPASPFQSSRASTAALPFPGRGMNAAPGRAVAEGSVIRGGRRESGEVWWFQPRAPPWREQCGTIPGGL